MFVSWSSFKSGRWHEATVAHVSMYVAVVETGDGSDKDVNGNDGSETGVMLVVQAVGPPLW